MFRRIGRAFKEAFWGFTHHIAMSISTANAVTVTLVLVSVLTLLISNISQITYDVSESIQIYATIDSSVADSSISTLKYQIEKLSGISSVEYSDSDSELDALISYYGDEGSIFEIYRNDNPLPRAFIVTLNGEDSSSLTDISSQIEKIEGINQVQFGGTAVQQFLDLMNGVRKVGYTFAIALTILAVFLIYNTIKITINSRKEEIGIMRLVGATNSYIRVPLILEGVFIGAIGSIIPILLTIYGYRYIYESMNGQLVSGILQLRPFNPFAYYVSAFVLALGMLVGFAGSLLSANKYLRWKR